tara:strand:+ start:2943 stop:4628 length:1686 start_codon:yes stop_codon:yes gene_type:complete
MNNIFNFCSALKGHAKTDEIDFWKSYLTHLEDKASGCVSSTNTSWLGFIYSYNSFLFGLRKSTNENERVISLVTSTGLVGSKEIDVIISRKIISFPASNYAGPNISLSTEEILRVLNDMNSDSPTLSPFDTVVSGHRLYGDLPHQIWNENGDIISSPILAQVIISKYISKKDIKGNKYFAKKAREVTLSLLRKSCSILSVPMIRALALSIVETFGASARSQIMKMALDEPNTDGRMGLSFAMTSKSFLRKGDVGVKLATRVFDSIPVFSLVKYFTATGTTKFLKNTSTINHIVYDLSDSAVNAFVGWLSSFMKMNPSISQIIAMEIFSRDQECLMRSLSKLCLVDSSCDHRFFDEVEYIFDEYLEIDPITLLMTLENTYTLVQMDAQCHENFIKENLTLGRLLFKKLPKSQRVADFITHASISLGSVKNLQLVKEQGLLNLDYRYTENKGDGKSIEWRKITAVSIKDEVTSFIASELKESGRVDNITITELLSELRKTRKPLREVWAKNNAALKENLLNKLSIKTIGDARLLMKVFDMTPIELLSYVNKDDTKSRLLKSLI